MSAGGALALAVIHVNRLGAYAYPVHQAAAPALAAEAAAS
jgi:hypothetical protein